MLEVAVRGEPLVHADEDDDHESVEDEPGDHEAPAPLCTGRADDCEEIHDDRGQAKSRDAELNEREGKGAYSFAFCLKVIRSCTKCEGRVVKNFLSFLDVSMSDLRWSRWILVILRGYVCGMPYCHPNP